MTIDFELDQLSPEDQRFLLLKANEWQCTPAQALARILNDRAKRDAKKEAA